jgi:transcription elongation factor Elf1
LEEAHRQHAESVYENEQQTFWNKCQSHFTEAPSWEKSKRLTSLTMHSYCFVGGEEYVIFRKQDDLVEVAFKQTDYGVELPVIKVCLERCFLDDLTDQLMRYGLFEAGWKCNDEPAIVDGGTEYQLTFEDGETLELVFEDNYPVNVFAEQIQTLLRILTRPFPIYESPEYRAIVEEQRRGIEKDRSDQELRNQAAVKKIQECLARKEFICPNCGNAPESVRVIKGTKFAGQKRGICSSCKNSFTPEDIEF